MDGDRAYWAAQVMSKALKEHGYYKKKGTVEKLASKYVAQIQMVDSGDVLQAGHLSPLQSCLQPPFHCVVHIIYLKKVLLLSCTLLCSSLLRTEPPILRSVVCQSHSLADAVGALPTQPS